MQSKVPLTKAAKLLLRLQSTVKHRNKSL